MTTDDVQIERTGDHVYLIRGTIDEEPVEVMLHADPQTVSLLAGEGADERRIVEETTDYLIRRQRADDLPATLDLADVAAAYENWFDDMRSILRGTPSASPGSTTPTTASDLN